MCGCAGMQGLKTSHGNWPLNLLSTSQCLLFPNVQYELNLHLSLVCSELQHPTARCDMLAGCSHKLTIYSVGWNIETCQTSTAADRPLLKVRYHLVLILKIIAETF